MITLHHLFIHYHTTVVQHQSQPNPKHTKGPTIWHSQWMKVFFYNLLANPLILSRTPHYEMGPFQEHAHLHIFLLDNSKHREPSQQLRTSRPSFMKNTVYLNFLALIYLNEQDC